MYLRDRTTTDARRALRLSLTLPRSLPTAETLTPTLTVPNRAYGNPQEKAAAQRWKRLALFRREWTGARRSGCPPRRRRRTTRGSSRSPAVCRERSWERRGRPVVVVVLLLSSWSLQVMLWCKGCCGIQVAVGGAVGVVFEIWCCTCC